MEAIYAHPIRVTQFSKTIARETINYFRFVTHAHINIMYSKASSISKPKIQLMAIEFSEVNC